MQLHFALKFIFIDLFHAKGFCFYFQIALNSFFSMFMLACITCLFLNNCSLERMSWLSDAKLTTHHHLSNTSEMMLGIIQKDVLARAMLRNF